jgi:hypothetical protein
LQAHTEQKKYATLYAQDLDQNLYHLDSVVMFCPFATKNLSILTNKRLLIFELDQDVRHPVMLRLVQPGSNAVPGVS